MLFCCLCWFLSFIWIHFICFVYSLFKKGVYFVWPLMRRLPDCFFISLLVFFSYSSASIWLILLFLCCYSPLIIGLPSFLFPPFTSSHLSIHPFIFDPVRRGEALHILSCLPTEDILSGGWDADRVHQSTAFKNRLPSKRSYPQQIGRSRVETTTTNNANETHLVALCGFPRR